MGDLIRMGSELKLMDGVNTKRTVEALLWRGRRFGRLQHIDIDWSERQTTAAEVYGEPYDVNVRRHFDGVESQDVVSVSGYGTD